MLHLMLAFVLSAVAADFSGTWALDKAASGSFEELLKAQGASYAERKAAKAVDVTQVIRQEGDQVTIEVQALGQTNMQVLDVDGATRTITVPKGQARVTHWWEGEALVTRSVGTDAKGASVETTLTRTLSPDGNTMTQRVEVLTPDGQRYSADRVFRRQGPGAD